MDEPLVETQHHVRKAMPVAAFAGILGIVGIIWLVIYSISSKS